MSSLPASELLTLSPGAQASRDCEAPSVVARCLAALGYLLPTGGGVSAPPA